MPDEVDRDQAFNERCLEALIEQPVKTHTDIFPAALSILRQGYSGKRRQTLPGVTTCTDCQSILEKRRRLNLYAERE